MDSKTLEALKSDKYPSITFQSSSVTISGNNVTAVGQLTIAGVTQTRTITAAYVLSKDASIIIKGVAKVKLSDYSMKPPTAMMGMLTTGNETDIVFEVNFKP